jgi:hypothetical protein
MMFPGGLLPSLPDGADLATPDGYDAGWRALAAYQSHPGARALIVGGRRDRAEALFCLLMHEAAMEHLYGEQGHPQVPVSAESAARAAFLIRCRP